MARERVGDTSNNPAIPKDSYLSRKGNCIIAVSADKTMNDLDPILKESLRQEDSRISFESRPEERLRLCTLGGVHA